MSNYLVVAHQTTANDELVQALKAVAERDRESEFELVVPATRITHLLTWVEGESEEVARSTAVEASRVLRQAGLNLVNTVVGPADPMKAIEDTAIRQDRQYEAIIISTLPLGVSRWLKRDLPSRVRSRLGVKVEHVVSTPPARRVAA
jgi:coproporphyrinogen III oxidase